MVIEKARKYRSYILVHGFDDAQIQDVRSYLDGESFKSVGIKNQLINNEAFASDSHILGCFVKSNVMSDIESAVESANKVGISCYLFSNLSFEVQYKLRPYDAPLKEILPGFFSDLLPKKLKDLCSFAVSSIVPNLIPDIEATFEESVSTLTTTTFNIQVHCETVARNFVGAITLRADTNLLKQRSEVLASISEQDIMDCLAEVSNQTLGIINYNLKKINIDARIGLPTIVNSPTEYNMRSSFYLPLCVLNDPACGISCKFYILYPFLKGTELLESVDFQVGAKQDGDVELF